MLLRTLLFLACIVSASAQPPERLEDRHAEGPDYPPINVISYDASIEIFPANDSIDGVVHIAILPARNSLQQIDLAAQGLAIRSVTSGAQSQRFEQDSTHVRIFFEQPRSTGSITTLTFTYGARPTRGLRIDSARMFAAFQTPRWMVCNFNPADRATLILGLTVPAGFSTIGPGQHFRRSAWTGNRVHDVWELHQPHPPYLYGFAVGRFTEATDSAHKVRLRYLAEGFSTDSLRHAFRSTIPALAFFISKAGGPLPMRSYTQAALAGAPAQEQAGFALLPRSFVAGLLEDEREDWLIPHELAHQWWGNSLTCASWSDFWLNEGMAVFMTAAFKEHHWGVEEYEREMVRARLQYERVRNAGKDRSLVYHDWKNPEDASGLIPYLKGALVLHMLRSWIGEDAFWKGIRIYTNGHLGQAVTTVDLWNAMQEAAPAHDLTSFFLGWVYRAGPASISARHEIERNSVVIVLEQHWPWATIVPLRIALQTDRKRITRAIELVTSRDTITLPLDGRLLSVRIDDGGNLPLRVDHPRTTAMLLYQLAHEPDVAGRADALLELVEHYAAETIEKRESIRRALKLRQNDHSRQISQMADQALKTIDAQEQR